MPRIAMRLGLVLLGVAALATPARAVLVDFTGSITLVFPSGVGASPSSVSLGTLSGDNLDVGMDGTIGIPPISYASVVRTVSLSGSTYISKLRFIAFGILGGTLSSGTQGFGGSAGLTGTVSFLPPGGLGLANLTVPLAIGSVFSSYDSTATAGGNYLSVSGSFSPWILGSTSITGTKDGTPTTTLNIAGSSMATGGGNTQLNLVSPVTLFRLGDAGSGPANRSIPAFGRLTLNFAPEPTALLLQGTAIAAVLLLGVRRLR